MISERTRTIRCAICNDPVVVSVFATKARYCPPCAKEQERIRDNAASRLYRHRHKEKKKEPSPDWSQIRFSDVNQEQLTTELRYLSKKSPSW